MKRRSLVVLLAGVLTATILSGVVAVAREPVPGEWSWSILGQETDCNTGSLFFRVRSWVNSVPDNDETYYQIGEIKFQGKNGRGVWNTYDHYKVDKPRFTWGDLPTYSTFADRTTLGLSLLYGAELRAYLTVWLKQVRPGPDKTVWKVTLSSPQPACSISGGS